MTKMTTLEDRLTIGELARAGYPDRQIARIVNWGLATVRKWRRRCQPNSPHGLASAMGRPATGPLSSYPPLLREVIRAWRVAHPGWGPKTLRAELAVDERFQGQKLPSLDSLARFLKAAGLSRTYQRHSPLPQPPSASAQAPHEVWEMDARGQQWVSQIGMISLINLNDLCSRTRLLSYPCWLGADRVDRHPDTNDYQLVLRLAFSEWGLPDQLKVDHDSVFYDNKSSSPFPTRFQLWLVALGVSLIFGQIAQPTAQGTSERSHQLWTQQVLADDNFATWEVLFEALRRRRDFLNNHLPCATLGELPPLVAYPQALIPRRLYRPEWEPELLDLSKIYAYLAQGRWFRLVSQAKTVSLGGQVYYLPEGQPRQQVEITFHRPTQTLLFQTAARKSPFSLPIQGISVEILLGEMDPLANFPAFQLALPFSCQQWRLLRLSKILDDTT